MRPAGLVAASFILVLGLLLLPCWAVRVPPGPNLPSAQRDGTTVPQTDSSTTALSSLLAAQAEAWNRGDIEGFMEGYWKSERTTFVGPSGVFRGWQALLDRYRRSYPDRAAMGRLQFSDLEVTPLAHDAALVLGHWQLEREKDRPGGVFTLVARRFPQGWRIIHDHTSALPQTHDAKH